MENVDRQGVILKPPKFSIFSGQNPLNKDEIQFYHWIFEVKVNQANYPEWFLR